MKTPNNKNADLADPLIDLSDPKEAARREKEINKAIDEDLGSGKDDDPSILDILKEQNIPINEKESK